MIEVGCKFARKSLKRLAHSIARGDSTRNARFELRKPSLSCLRPEFIDCHQARNANKALLCACSRYHVSQKGMTKNKRPPHESNKRRLKRRLKRLLSQTDWNDFWQGFEDEAFDRRPDFMAVGP